ncbi:MULTISPECIES: hypothetical protein [unclassified Streptomyces]|uniref:hypothetical protein n=1 Tax=unclassified Streptomyces TaxID=2593676 RepID=UPI002789C209|nr:MULTISPECIES: hypothetical protein [unclassified Streptomyces]MDQ0701001.1 hypothetical protein [Streptomyces sp. W4I9-2]MDX3488219.1 hypothetical protein [Streptomyces sp. ID05-18]
MSHGEILTQKARYRARCTGLGHQASLQHLHALQGQDPVPAAADRDQARLEAAVFERLGGTIDYCAHPAGVAKVRPGADHLVLELDPKLGPEHSLPEHSLLSLLPTQYTGPEDDEGAPGGIAGVRLLGIDTAGVHLGLVGTAARVTFTGPAPEQWRTIVTAHRASCRDGNLVPLWDAPALTSFESDYLASDHAWHEERADVAWVASGLLRRIALFHTVTKPYCVRYWQHGLGWKFELRYDHDVPMDHEAFLAYLTHPAWGMRLKADREHCVCKPCDCDGGAERNCWYTLNAGGGRHGEIGIHFRRSRVGRDTGQEHGRLVGAGASPGWLAQALPSHYQRSAA